jgi:putative restriction endonuclease
MPLSSQDVLKAFDRIRVFQRGEQRAVHKPLLILMALARIAQGAPRLVRFEDIDAPFKQLLTEFGPSSAPGSRHYPFWHLATDGLWQLEGPASLLNRPAGATPNLGELRQLHVAGGFSPDVDAALRHDPALRAQLARQLLDAHFPETLHGDILGALGLDLNTEPANAAEEATTTRTQARRDPRFRERVLRAYEYRCCVCGFDLRIGNITAGLEAAHIKWFQAKGPDIEANGLALCALHHKVFDLGAFTILPDTYSLVFSQHAVAGEASRHMLMGFHGAGLILPQSKDYYPKAEFLKWHEGQVFKKPGRPQAW